nr:MAG TPA: cysteine hydrolase [Caudoviricetes sp.]
MKLLVVVDMQNDFINGSLGSEAAQAIVPNVIEKIKSADKNTAILFTRDTHYDDYAETLEGRKLPVQHCRDRSYGWEINEDIFDAWYYSDTYIINEPEVREGNIIIKNTFGSIQLMSLLIREGKMFDEIEFIGLLSEICVISNVLMTRAVLPDMPIVVDASCCAGSTPKKHKAALEVMKSCQIDIINESEV